MGLERGENKIFKNGSFNLVINVNTFLLSICSLKMI